MAFIDILELQQLRTPELDDPDILARQSGF